MTFYFPHKTYETPCSLYFDDNSGQVIDHISYGQLKECLLIFLSAFFALSTLFLKNSKYFLEYLLENNILWGAHRKGLHGPIPATKESILTDGGYLGGAELPVLYPPIRYTSLHISRIEL